MCRSEGHVFDGAADQRPCQAPRGLQAHHAHLSGRCRECQSLQAQIPWSDEQQPAWVKICEGPRSRWCNVHVVRLASYGTVFSFSQIKHLFERLRLCSYSSRHTLVRSACEGLSTGPEQWGPVPGSALPRRCWRDELLCGGPQVSWQRLRWAHQHQPQSVGAHLCSKIRNVFTVCISSPTMCSLCRLIFFTLCFMQNSLWWNCKT